MPAKVAFLQMSSPYLLPARLDVTDLLGTDSAVLSPFRFVLSRLLWHSVSKKIPTPRNPPLRPSHLSQEAQTAPVSMCAEALSKQNA